MNCACSRSINTSSKVTDPSVDATWLRHAPATKHATSGICMQSPSITDFMDENGAFRSNRFPYSWCYRFKTWDVWWLLQKKVPNLTLFVALCGLHALLSECLAGRPRTTSTFTPFITTYYNQLTPSFASALFEHFSATVHAMIWTSEPSPMAFRSLWDRPETNPSNLMILMSSFHYETFIVWYSMKFYHPPCAASNGSRTYGRTWALPSHYSPSLDVTWRAHQ